MDLIRAYACGLLGTDCNYIILDSSDFDAIQKEFLDHMRADDADDADNANAIFSGAYLGSWTMRDFCQKLLTCCEHQ